MGTLSVPGQKEFLVNSMEFHYTNAQSTRWKLIAYGASMKIMTNWSCMLNLLYSWDFSLSTWLLLLFGSPIGHQASSHANMIANLFRANIMTRGVSLSSISLWLRSIFKSSWIAVVSHTCESIGKTVQRKFLRFLDAARLISYRNTLTNKKKVSRLPRNIH